MTLKATSLVLVCAITTLSLPCLAQADNLFGGGLGVNFSTLTNQAGSSGNTEFQVGAFADWGLGDIWYLETGLRYNSYGVSASATSGSTTLGASSDIHYLEVPVLIKPTFNMGGLFPYLIAGPVIGFKVGETGTVSVNGASASASTSIYNTMNLAIDLGVGTEVPITPAIRGFLQFDYALGVINVVSSSANAGTADTRGANLTAGVAVPF